MSPPTLRQAEATIGREELLVRLAAKINDCLELYFPPQQRLHEDLIPVFAENLMDQYPHEYIGDVGAFFSRASMGRYGEKGKTYGALTMPTLGSWWMEYIDERAAEEEKLRKAPRGEKFEVAPVVADAMREAAEDMDAKDTGKHVRKLMKYVSRMTDDQLRDEWKKCKTAHERSLIMQEANRRGLVQQRIEDHLSKLDNG